MKTTGVLLYSSSQGRCLLLRCCLASRPCSWSPRRRVEQSGFTPGRSTIDRILTLNTLIQTRREFGQPFCVAYVDLKSAFDSVDRESLWLLLCRLGVPEKMVCLVQALCTDTRLHVAVFGLMACALIGSRSSLEYVRAVLLPRTCFWLQ